MPSHSLFGIIPAVATPLDAEGGVDELRLSRFAGHLLDSGVHGLFANGSMGGFPFLTDREQDRAISAVVDTAQGRVSVLGGLAELGTVRAVKRAREIAGCGVTHLSALAPLFYLTNQDQLIRYFSEIASAVDLPLIIYDNPVLTKNPIDPDTIAELRRRIPTFVAVKESNQDCINLQRLLSVMKGDEDFAVFTGSEYLMLVGLQMGVTGAVGGLHNIHPVAAVKLYEAFVAGDIVGAEQWQNVMIELGGIFSATKSIWGGFEDAMRYLGVAERVVGEPYVTAVSAQESERVRDILRKHVEPVFPSLALLER